MWVHKMRYPKRQEIWYNIFRPVGWVSCGVVDMGNVPIVNE